MSPDFRALSRRLPPAFLSPLSWAGLGMALLIVATLHWMHNAGADAPSPSRPATLHEARFADFSFEVDPPPPARGLLYTFPTPQTQLHDPENPEVYMPTASGRVRSAHYGSTRTNAAGRPVFHEGVDIGPTRRDRRQHALDPIYAVADGKVAHINPIAGNSTYGIYVVLTHEDEFGEFYTLYAHLGRPADFLEADQPILRGEPIGIMGHTSSFHIPVQRAHLHFEIGVINNSHFHAWYRAKERLPDHGTYHGHNLTGIDPMRLLLRLQPDKEIRFSMLDTLRNLPVAFSVAMRSPGQLDYFHRHPTLWEGPPFTGGVMTVDFCEAGTPVRGRVASESEAQGVTSRRPRVVDVNQDALGRNGRRKITRSGNNWQMTRWGMEWMEILLYRAR